MKKRESGAPLEGERPKRRAGCGKGIDLETLYHNIVTFVNTPTPPYDVFQAERDLAWGLGLELMCASSLASGTLRKCLQDASVPLLWFGWEGER